MHRRSAEELTEDLLACSGKLDRSVAIIQSSSNPDFFQKYRTSVGQVMGLFYLEILRDVFRLYPDLEPKITERAEPPIESSESALDLVSETQSLMCDIRKRLQIAPSGDDPRIREAIESALSMIQEIADLLPQSRP